MDEAEELQKLAQSSHVGIEGLSLGGLQFNVWTLLAGFIFGTFGWFIFKKGKKESYPLRMIVGAILFIYPYFITHSFFVWIIGIVLLIYNARFL